MILQTFIYSTVVLQPISCSGFGFLSSRVILIFQIKMGDQFLGSNQILLVHPVTSTNHSLGFKGCRQAATESVGNYILQGLYCKKTEDTYFPSLLFSFFIVSPVSPICCAAAKGCKMRNKITVFCITWQRYCMLIAFSKQIISNVST